MKWNGFQEILSFSVFANHLENQKSWLHVPRLSLIQLFQRTVLAGRYAKPFRKISESSKSFLSKVQNEAFFLLLKMFMPVDQSLDNYKSRALRRFLAEFFPKLINFIEIKFRQICQIPQDLQSLFYYFNWFRNSYLIFSPWNDTRRCFPLQPRQVFFYPKFVTIYWLSKPS